MVNFRRNFFNKKTLVFMCLFLFSCGIIMVPRIFAESQAVKSVEFFSEKLDYTSKEPGSWKITKSAKWTEKGIAEITFDLDTVIKSDSKYTDIVFVLDVSDSMEGEKLNRVKEDAIELVTSLLSNENNKAGLITFETGSEIITPFTNNKEELIEIIRNLTTGNTTNYYQALVNVDLVLKDYVKEADKECVVLFLTDGYPNEETPNEEGQYEYLKNQYPFITINGVQYEMGNSILDPIKNISDNQYIADMETLNNVLFEASVSPVTYENFEITDYIDTNYFFVESKDDIKISQGSIDFDNTNQKFTWKLNSLKAGAKEKMTIKAKLKESLIGEGGFYSTNEKEEIKSKIDSKEEYITSSKTPVLRDNYKVRYDGNEPSDCRVEGVPAEKQHSVLDTISISDSEPKCDGYQFKGWDILTKDVKKINGDYFIMPEEDVIIKANWSRLDITKSMTGTVKDSLTLYKQVKLDYENNNHAEKYDGTKSGSEEVYYYNGATPNNNVIFGGFCWRMMRTTDTGGVKMIYNGEPDVEGKCGTDRSNHVGYGYRTWRELSSKYNYGTDYTYDEVSKTFTLSGNLEQAIWNDSTSAGLIGKYTCLNTSGTCTSLYQVDSYKSNSEAYIFLINSSINYSAIGNTQFNADEDSASSVGYMYNKQYNSSSKYFLTKSMTISLNYSLSRNYYYANDIEWVSANRSYNLKEPFKILEADDYSSLIGKYTFFSSNENYTRSEAYYIFSVNGSTAKVVKVSSGADLAAANKSYYFADSLLEDETGKKTLDPSSIKEVKEMDWLNIYKDYTNKYLCETMECSSIYYVTGTSDYGISYVNTADDYMFGNSFVYNEETKEYTLSGETQHFFDWSGNYDNLENTHYTCWNTSGVCREISYIYIIDRQIPYYIRLENGESVDDALEAMLNADDVNMYNSTIKTVIDNWYARNMIPYTEYLEDTVWCNDRQISNKNISGWNPNGGKNSRILEFGLDSSGSLICPTKRDSFTVSEENGNGKLTYPVGLVTENERRLAYSSQSAIMSGNYFWGLTPDEINYTGASNLYVNPEGWLSKMYIYTVDERFDVRPVISLRKDIEYKNGKGTVDDPYVIDLESQ